MAYAHELDARSPAGVRNIIAILQRAIRSERVRGQAGHWTYSLPRHNAMLRALKAETALFRRLDAEAA